MASAVVEKKKRVQKPSKEDFEKQLAVLEKDLTVKNKELEVARSNAKKVQGGPGGKNEERDTLRKELEQLKRKQAELKAARDKVFGEIRVVDERLKKKVKDLQAAKGKVSFKNVEEIDAQITKLERSVDSGNLRLVDEKRTLAEISQLKKARKNFGGFADAQASIDADRNQIALLKKSLDDSESKKTSEQYNEVIKKLDALRDEQNEAFKNRSALFDKRSECEKAREAVRGAINTLKDDYYNQLREFRKQAEAERAARIEREKAERAAYEKEKKLRDIEAKIDAASEPAFANQITIAENLLSMFDPEYKKTSEPLVKESGFAAKPLRTVEDVPEGAKIIKKSHEELFSGSVAKKNKKKNRDENKFTVDVSVIENLATLNVPVPTSKEDLPNTVNKIKEKIEYYKQNQERVTAERVERAKAELAKLEEQEDNTETKEEESAPAEETKAE
ncbi:nuclear segregation protein Bfr1p [Trichomonascus vanleenenianus]|uniref:Bfr1p n=1 Tax=Trichomonascus vanleenenianus TaxID=2268995 RepID=UPI003EC9D998